MKPKHESNDLLVWREAPHPHEKNSTKVVELKDYRRDQMLNEESTILSWDVPTVELAKPVKLLMISSGFTIRSSGGSNIQSMAA
jgi:hypothetical protein